MNISTFAALADPMRLALVEALRDGEQPVNELVERVHIQQSGVSRHLGILHRAGLVEVRPEGQQRFYSLRAAAVRRARRMGRAHSRALGGSPRSIRRRIAASQAKPNKKTAEYQVKKRINLQRTFNASLDLVWELWTTKDGIESWWGPPGFEVKVSKLELRAGGALEYVMTCVGAEQIAFMKQHDQPLSTPLKARYTEVEPEDARGVDEPRGFHPRRRSL